MRRIEINVPIYDWTVTICTIYGESCSNEIAQLADEFELPDKEELVDLTKIGHNGGRTYARTGSRNLVVLIFPWTNKEHFIQTLNHEKRHIIDDIVEWHDLEGKEASAYLDGFISKEIYKQIDKLIT